MVALTYARTHTGTHSYTRTHTQTLTHTHSLTHAHTVAVLRPFVCGLIGVGGSTAYHNEDVGGDGSERGGICCVPRSFCCWRHRGE